MTRWAGQKPIAGRLGRNVHPTIAVLTGFQTDRNSPSPNSRGFLRAATRMIQGSDFTEVAALQGFWQCLTLDTKAQPPIWLRGISVIEATKGAIRWAGTKSNAAGAS